MQKQNPILTLHEALASAMLRDLPDSSYTVPDREAIAKLKLTPKEVAEQRSAGTLPQRQVPCRPSNTDVEVQVFLQTWGSTALGYGGMGGSAMTPAYTVIASTYSEACVYFGGGTLAYRIMFETFTDAQRDAWVNALAKRWMPSRREAVEAFGAHVPD